MADISSIINEYPETAEIHILSIDNECKELLILLKRGKTENNPLIKAVSLDNNKEFSFRFDEEKNAAVQFAAPDELKGYLYEPDASLLKSGAFKLLSQRFSLKKISKGTHYYISSAIIPEFPGKIRHIVESIPFNNQGKRLIVKKYPECSVTSRNYPSSSEEIKKRLGLKESDRFRMLATTLNDSSRYAIISELI